jgi:hypothetical protein
MSGPARIVGTRIARRARIVGLLAAGVVVAGSPAPATAAFPGANGKIVFERTGNVWLMAASGLGAAPITTDGNAGQRPAWSPDGTRIAFDRSSGPDPGVWVMAPDGTQQKKLTTDGSSPYWPPALL